MNADRHFLDTNVFAYTFDLRDTRKRKIADALIVSSLRDESGVASFQVVHEFVNLAVRETVPGFGAAEAALYISETFAKLILVQSSLNLCLKALSIRHRYQFHWYDSLIVAAALDSGCKTLFSEDLQHRQVIDGLKIVNPFYE